MSADKRFVDTNVLIYLTSSDVRKSDIAEGLVAQGGCISVQVLNELASVALRKLKMSHAEIRQLTALLKRAFQVIPISLDTHTMGMEISERYGFSIYDSLIAASALLAKCSLLVTEDLHAGQILEGSLRIENPFVA